MRGYLYPVVIAAVYTATRGVHLGAVEWLQAVVFRR